MTFAAIVEIFLRFLGESGEGECREEEKGEEVFHCNKYK